MIELSRSVRVCVNPEGLCEAGKTGRNTFAAWPSMAGLGAFYEFEVRCSGEPDSVTGYLVNISEIDAAVRSQALPLVEQAFHARANRSPAALLPGLLQAIQPALGNRVASLRWRLTPYYSVTMHSAAPDHFVLRESFEFAAAHRLNCRGMTDAENQRLFGKCNNPSGHGHNYRVEVAAAIPFATPGGGRNLDHLALERTVDDLVVKRFDHKNLDLDTTEFSAVNSSVENIARACHDLLRDPIARLGATLKAVTVWETEKTSCTYPG